MDKIYVIESVTSPGSFFSHTSKKFRDWMHASRYDGPDSPGIMMDLSEASFIAPCKVVEIYVK